MNTRVTLGLYAGSFNPFTVGHLDILKQAIHVFDEIVVAQGVNSHKSQEEKFPLPSEFLHSLNSNISTRLYKGLLTELVKELENEYYDVVLIRGLRNGADLEYEQNLIAFLKDMHHNLKSVAFYCDPKFRHISSSQVRAIRHFSQEEYKRYVVS
jgi:pantetheine-phosphate adenylyltransferase